MEIFKKMIYEKAQSTKEDLLNAIPESWIHFHKEYCFKLVKCMPQLMKTVIKA